MQCYFAEFESIKQTNQEGVEVWSARALASLLEYEWHDFKLVIQRAIGVCKLASQPVEAHFIVVQNSIDSSIVAGDTVEDYVLSRLACYLIIQNSNPHKPKVAAAQIYLAACTRANEVRQWSRQQGAESDSGLAEVAHPAGVQSPNFGKFQDAGYLGQYLRTAAEIREYKGLPGNAEILDHMGREELAANLFRITQTDSKIRRENITGEEKAMQTHHGVGRQVRKAIVVS